MHSVFSERTNSFLDLFVTQPEDKRVEKYRENEKEKKRMR